MNDVIPLFQEDSVILIAVCPECGYEVWYLEADSAGNFVSMICGNDEPEAPCDYKRDMRDIVLALDDKPEKEGEE